MRADVELRLVELRQMAVRHRVRSLALFGSAATGAYREGESDLDFLVEFQPIPVREYADAYFGLMEDLEGLFGARIDLVESKPLSNRYLRAEIERTKQVLYEAA